MLSTHSRRLTARIAVAGALAVIPLAAVAGPALADTTAHAPTGSAPIDWRHHGWDHGGGGWNHGLGGWNHGGGWHHHGWDHGGGWNPGWGGGLPNVGDLDTGSAG